MPDSREGSNPMGMSVSDAVRLFMHRVVAEQAFPLELKVPNAATRAALAEADKLVRSRRKRYAGTDELFDSLAGDKKGRGRYGACPIITSSDTRCSITAASSLGL